jgi:hypothetical protein
MSWPTVSSDTFVPWVTFGILKLICGGDAVPLAIDSAVLALSDSSFVFSNSAYASINFLLQLR